MLRDPLPVLRAPPLVVLDIVAQREAGPAAAVRKVGVGVNGGFMLVRQGCGFNVETLLRRFAINT